MPYRNPIGGKEITGTGFCCSFLQAAAAVWPSTDERTTGATAIASEPTREAERDETT